MKGGVYRMLTNKLSFHAIKFTGLLIAAKIDYLSF